MTKLILKPFWLMALIIITLHVNAQTVKADFTSDEWQVEAAKHEFTDFKGKKSLYLENGKAKWKDSQFKNGIIDYDIHFEEARMFLGVHFRIQDALNYEEFYIRPHQSGNPDAMQYTPVINGNTGWQLYHGKGYSNAYKYNFGEWNHIRLVVSGGRMEVFINDMSQPILHAFDLKMDTKKGGLGFSAALSGAYYANLVYEEKENPLFMSESEEPPQAETGTITQWQVSSAFASSSLTDVVELKTFEKNTDLEWKMLPTQPSGLIHLARVSPLSEKTNTVLAKAIIISDKDQVKQMAFGYSDAVHVFVNGQIIYSGQNAFRSRDYRYLGTIGYFDAIHLHLKKGRNEVVFAVSENFGGWGLQAKLADMKGIAVQN